MSVRQGQAVEEDGLARGDTPERICTAALMLIAERGFDGTSVEDIAVRAGVAKGTIYYHFPGKTAVFEAVLRRIGAALGLALREAVDGARGEGTDTLVAAVTALLGMVDAHPELIRVLLTELFHEGRSWQALLREIYEDVVAVFVTVLDPVSRDGAAAGAGAGDGSPPGTAAGDGAGPGTYGADPGTWSRQEVHPVLRTAGVAVFGMALLVAVDHARVATVVPLEAVGAQMGRLLSGWGPIARG